MVRESHGPREPSSGMLSQCVVAAQRGSSGNFIFGLMSTRYYSAAGIRVQSRAAAAVSALEVGGRSVIRCSLDVQSADSR